MIRFIRRLDWSLVFVIALYALFATSMGMIVVNNWPAPPPAYTTPLLQPDDSTPTDTPTVLPSPTPKGTATR